MNQKLVVVTGATGTQGGSVVRGLLADGTFKIRAITRRPTSPDSKELASQGVEVIKATLDDPESLLKAFAGAYAVFGVTPFGDETEEQQGKNIVNACTANNVSLLVWSSLPHGAETSGGKYTGLTHYDRKASVDKYIKQVGQPAIVIYTGVFSENLAIYHSIQKVDDGGYTVSFHISPPVAVPHTWIASDLGPAVTAMMVNWDKPEIRSVLEAEQPIHVCSYRISGIDMAESVSRVLGKRAKYTGERSTGTGELAEMFRYQDDGLLYPNAEIPPPILTKLGVKFHTFDDFVAAEIAPQMK